MLILAVEDDDAVRDSLARTVRLGGYDAVPAPGLHDRVRGVCDTLPDGSPRTPRLRVARRVRRELRSRAGRGSSWWPSRLTSARFREWGMSSGLDGLVELALRPWGRPQVGVERLARPEGLVELQPSFPIPGPNHVCLVRCVPERVDALIDEVRGLFAARGLPSLWILDSDVEPADLGDRLTARGIIPFGTVDVMVLPVTAPLEPGSAAIEVVDALSDEAAFWDAEAVQAAAFDDGGPFPGQHERYEEACADPSRRFYLALVDGAPAGAGWATVRDEGVLMNGGAVDPRFRGRGVYRALVAARLRLARDVGAAGLGVQARPDTSGPILRGFGFRTVGGWSLHIDRAGLTPAPARA